MGGYSHRKGIIAAPKDAQVDHHPDIIYDTSNKAEEGEGRSWWNIWWRKWCWIHETLQVIFQISAIPIFYIFIGKNRCKIETITGWKHFRVFEEISRSDFVAQVTEASNASCPCFPLSDEVIAINIYIPLYPFYLFIPLYLLYLFIPSHF